MFEKIIPLIIALFAFQFFIRYMNKRKKNNQSSVRNFDYKKRIDEIMKISNYDEGVNAGQLLKNDIRSGLGKPELMLGIPDNMRDVRSGLNLIIDAVTNGVKGKIGSLPAGDNMYKDSAAMFDEIIEVIKKHKTE